MYTKNFYNKNLKKTARELRRTMTAAETKLWFQFLSTIEPRAHRQRSMGNFIADFYIPKAKLVVEVDGEIHLDEKSKAKDLERTWYFNNQGVEVVRVTNDQVINSFKKTCKSLRQAIGSRILKIQTKPPLSFREGDLA